MIYHFFSDNMFVKLLNSVLQVQTRGLKNRPKGMLSGFSGGDKTKTIGPPFTHFVQIGMPAEYIKKKLIRLVF